MLLLVPSTVTALVILLTAVLPGALYTWAFEQQAGRWGASASDRLTRFAGTSALFLVLGLPAVYEGYRRFVVTGDLAAGRALPVAAWLLPALVLLAPFALGRAVGRATYKRRGWARLLTGPAPAPRAWDDLFAQADLTGWIVLRLKCGGHLAGYWGASSTTGLRSYAAGYPDAQDLLLAETAEVDDDGDFVLDENGFPRLTGAAALVRWDEVEYASFARD
jgi:hypothetical protein